MEQTTEERPQWQLQGQTETTEIAIGTQTGLIMETQEMALQE